MARPAEACRIAGHDGDDSAIVRALPEEQLIPLSRLNDGFEIELEGLAFGMVDRQGHRWRCLITDRVLSDAIGGAPTQSGPSAVLGVGWLIALAALGFAGSGVSALPKSTSLGSQLFCYRRSIVTGCLLLA